MKGFVSHKGFQVSVKGFLTGTGFSNSVKGFGVTYNSVRETTSNMADMFNESNRSANGYTSSLINDAIDSDYRNYLIYRLLINI